MYSFNNPENGIRKNQMWTNPIICVANSLVDSLGSNSSSGGSSVEVGKLKVQQYSEGFGNLVFKSSGGWQKDDNIIIASNPNTIAYMSKDFFKIKLAKNSLYIFNIQWQQNSASYYAISDYMPFLVFSENDDVKINYRYTPMGFYPDSVSSGAYVRMNYLIFYETGDEEIELGIRYGFSIYNTSKNYTFTPPTAFYVNRYYKFSNITTATE